MAETKRMVNMGWAFREERMLEKFSQFAGEGWVFKKQQKKILFFEFEKGAPEYVDFAMTYPIGLEDRDEYIQIFAGSGWTLVSDCCGYLIFKAPKGAVPIFTEKSHLVDLWKNEMRKWSLYFVVSLLWMIAFGFFLNVAVSSKVLEFIFLIGFILTVMLTFIFGMTTMGFAVKWKKCSKR